MERRFISASACPVTLQQRAEGQTPRIEGYGAVYYDGTPATEYVLWDFASERAVERILTGAFDKALSRPDDVRGQFNHDPNHVLGRTAAKTMSLTTDVRGLLYSIDPGDTTSSRDLQIHLKRGDVSGSSIMFSVEEERWTQTKDASEKWFSVREILSVKLYDVGPVTFPAYDSTTAAVRSDADVKEARASLEKYLRSAGAGAGTPNLNLARLRLADLAL